MAAWTRDELSKIARAEEVDVAAITRAGSVRNRVTIWAVRHGDELFIRSIRGRDGAWFRALHDPQARARQAAVKAVVCTGYGPPEVLQVRNVPDPQPRANEVCIRLNATAVTASDCLVRGLKLRGRYRLFMRV